MRLLILLCTLVALSSCTVNRSIYNDNRTIINSYNHTTCEGMISTIVELEDCCLHFNGTCSAYSKWCASGHSRDVLTSMGYVVRSHSKSQCFEVYKP